MERAKPVVHSIKAKLHHIAGLGHYLLIILIIKSFFVAFEFFFPSLLRHRTTKTQALKGSRNLFAAFSLILPKSWLGFNPSLLLAAMHYPEPAEFL